MIVVCTKWVAHPGEPFDERYAGASPADRAALELALRQAALTGDEVAVVTVGPAGADGVLRDAAAAGAHRCVRVDAPVGMSSAAVADAIVAAVRDVVGGASWVWCGDYSLDRGSASVPAFVAHGLHARQALGVIEVDMSSTSVRAVRRLDAGRREVVELSSPAVVSVEGSVATLRRASLSGVRAAAAVPITVVTPPAVLVEEPLVRPYRPRARALAAPAGGSAVDRVRALTTTGGSGRGEVVELSPDAAARRILDALVGWGYLSADADGAYRRS